MRLLSTLVLVLAFVTNTHSQGWSGDKPFNFNDFIYQSKRGVVYFGRPVMVDTIIEYEPFATGFLLSVDKESYLVTAKHVVWDYQKNRLDDLEIVLFAQTKQNGIHRLHFPEYRKESGNEWIFHNNSRFDIAALKLRLPNPPYDHYVQPAKYAVKNIRELLRVVFVSYQPGVIDVVEKLNPVMRTGMISLVKYDGTILIDGSAFPGNSGSPVFTVPEVTVDQSGNYVGILGVVTSYVPYNEIAYSNQTHRPRVVFEENTGLSNVVPIDKIVEMIRVHEK